MRRIFRLILMMGIFLGGYYLGRRPGSPDLIGYGKGAYHWAVRTGERISARAEEEDTSLTKAAVATAVDAISEQEVPGLRD